MAESDFDLYFDVLQTLGRLEIDYVIIGAFAGVSYGVTRVGENVEQLWQHLQTLTKND